MSSSIMNESYDSSTSIGSDNEQEEFKTCQQKQINLSEIISTILNILIEDTHTNNEYSSIISKQSHCVFSMKAKPSIAVSDFIKRLVNYSNVEYSTLISAVIYLDKILSKNLYLTEYNVHLLFSVCLLEAIKMNEDKIYSNSVYAKIFGISLRKLNQIEYEFLVTMKFNLHIEEKDFETINTQLLNYGY